MDITHLTALQTRLAHETARYVAETSPAKTSLRAVWIRQIEKEIAAEKRRLGLTEPEFICNLTDDDLLAELL
jgi:hypothetical protein